MLIKEENAGVNCKDHGGSMPLIYAIHLKLIKVLIDANANVNAKNNTGKTALEYAIIYNQSEIVKALLEAGSSVDKYLINNVKKVNADIKELVLNYYNLFNQAKDKTFGSKEILREAIEKGYIAIVKYLLKKQISIDAEDLKLAKINNKKAIGKMIISHSGLSTKVSGISSKGLGVMPEIANLIASFIHE